MTIDNEDRALRISKAAGVIYPDEGDAETILRDLLSDARHFADRERIEFALVDRMAYEHYLTEKAVTGVFPCTPFSVAGPRRGR
jgi:site-specific DNA-cytosine methylase